MKKRLVTLAIAGALLPGTLLADEERSRLPSIHRLNLVPAQSTTASLCVFCHTPLGNRQFELEQPGWDRMPQGSDGVYPTISLMTTTLDERSVGHISVVCLSCHDGAQAPDIESPAPAGSLAEAGSEPDPLGAARFEALRHPPGGYSGSHPVAVPYGGGDERLWNPETELDRLESRALTFHRPQQAVSNDLTVWWVETGLPGRQKDDIQLYSRLPEGSNEPVPFVECSSCHDPHGTQPRLLRADDGGSNLCVSCHDL